MSQENIFYVYEHWRPDKNVCFYVGKGNGKRAWNMKQMRNRHHMAITSKLTSLGLIVDVRIILSGVSARTALSFEIDRIASHGRENLCNMTGGGDGLVDPSPEVRRKMSISIRAANSRDETKKRRAEAAKNRPLVSAETRRKLSLVWTGRKHSQETILKMKKAAKVRGVSVVTRIAQVAACTGKKRAAFKESTIIKMRNAAKVREQVKRQIRGAR